MITVRKPYRCLAAALALAVAGCAGSATSNAIGGAGTANLPSAVGLAQPLRIAGAYTGTVTDSQRGKGKVTLELTSGSGGYGGTVAAKFGSTAVRGIVLLNAPAPKMSGTEVALFATPCSYAMDATFDAKTSVLRGSYRAIHRCTGQRGTFTATQQCYYVYASGSNAVDRPLGIGMKAC